MKKEQLIRIEEFVTSLENPILEENQQAVVLQSELSVIAGDNGTCSNDGALSCSGINKRCTNYGHVCDTSDNGKNCKNYDKIIDDPNKPIV
ncbi:MAG: hypothetical protein LUF85_16815 [Bacteroides sp.]|nr:hypothetical protein [Bacteroides sp.]